MNEPRRGVLAALSDPPIVALLAVAIVLNFAGGEVVKAAHLPVYGDSIGTMLVGILGGPVLGAIGVVQTDRPVDMAAATAAAVGAGVWLRPFRDLVYTMPPYISTPDDVAAICRGVAAVVAS